MSYIAFIDKIIYIIIIVKNFEKSSLFLTFFVKIR